MRKFMSVLLSAAMVLTAVPVSVVVSPVVEVNADDEVVENLEYAATITLYGIDSDYGMGIPSNYAQSYQINDDDAISYSVYSGNTVTVTSDGLIEPAYTTWYYTDEMMTTEYTEGAESSDYIRTGTSVVKVATDKGYYLISVTVEDYSDVYVDEVIDEFISENITSDMTDLQLMNTICSFPASYDYDDSYSSAKGMIMYGGGTCWASTDLIVMTCEKLGITAWWRNGNKDDNAGSGHVNAMAELNGVYYELEAGYVGTAPRYYSVDVRTSLFSTREVDGGLEVYQYDGNVTGEYEVVIPEEIDGQTVVSIGKKFAYMDSYLTKVTIPDTVTSIGDMAFEQCYALEEANIPANVETIGEKAFFCCILSTDIFIPESVTSIGACAFSGCSGLTSIEVADENAYYISQDGVLYNKNMTELICCPGGRTGSFTVPDGVKEIADCAFENCANITSVTLSDTVTTIGKYAFDMCSSLTTVELSENLTSIGYGAFMLSGLTKITIPEGITSIPDACFSCCLDLKVVKMYNSVTEIGVVAFSACNSLTDIYYSGTETEWNKIVINDTYGTLSSVNIHYNSNFIEKGDVNLDDSVTYLDAMTILRYDAELMTLTDEQLSAGDVNGDGSVNSLDAILILRYDAGLISSFN